MAKRQISVLNQPFNRRSSGRLLSANIRDFSGGLNEVDDDELLNLKFAKVLKNLHRGTDGSLILRHGTQWYADVKAVVSGTILDGRFFREKLVYVMTSGEICTVDDAGVAVAIWNAALAGAITVPGAQLPWSGGLTQVSFVPFSETLIIHNGIDKPIVIDKNYHVDYLGDVANTNSNVRVPIGKYGCAVASYHCVANIIGAPTVISISATKVAGLFQGATTLPNDAVEINVGSYAPSETTEIQGIAGYRNNLIVFFRLDSIIIQLGEYTVTETATTHVPKFTDVLPHFGLISQRSLVPVENDLLFASPIGVGSVRRNLLAGLIESQPLSTLIGPRYMHEIRNDTVPNLQTKSFAVHNELSGRGTTQAMFFNPNGTCFVYTFSPELKIRAWSEYAGLSWVKSAAQSAKGRIFFTTDTRVYRMGNDVYTGEALYADRLQDRIGNWTNNQLYAPGNILRDTVLNKSYMCLFAHFSAASGSFELDRTTHPTYWEEYLGELLSFEWELPWFDARTPMNVKHTKYIRLGSKGSSQFTIEAYADGLFEDINGVIEYPPGLSLPMVCNEFPQWGQPVENIEFGGGRPSNYPSLYSFPIKFERLKLRLLGSTRSPARFFWIMLLYKLGSLHR